MVSPHHCTGTPPPPRGYEHCIRWGKRQRHLCCSVRLNKCHSILTWVGIIAQRCGKRRFRHSGKSVRPEKMLGQTKCDVSASEQHSLRGSRDFLSLHLPKEICCHLRLLDASPINHCRSRVPEPVLLQDVTQPSQRQGRAAAAAGASKGGVELEPSAAELLPPRDSTAIQGSRAPRGRCDPAANV